LRFCNLMPQRRIRISSSTNFCKMKKKKDKFQIYGNDVELYKRKNTYVVDIYLNEEIMESFDSEEEAEEKSEKWARKTFFYLCDEGIIDQESDNAKTKVNISVKKY
jgi:hypothetical protein